MAVLVLAAGGGVWRSKERGVFENASGAAFKPWEDWRGEAREGPLALVSASILAANAHNTQPWLFRMEDSRIDLFADKSREIGNIDPFLREMYIGLGCALENLLLAARAKGYRHYLLLTTRPREPHARRQGRSLAVRRGNIAPVRLYEAIPNRHTNRYPYETSRPVSRGTLDALETLNDEQDVKVFWFASKGKREKVGDLLVDAAKAINVDKKQSYDNSLRWLRRDGGSIEHYRDRLTLDTMGLLGPTLLAAKILPSPSLQTSGEAWLSSLNSQARSASAFGMLAIRDYSDDSQRMRAGRLWQRMHLWIIANRLAAQPMNQLHERRDREIQQDIEPKLGNALKDLLRNPSWHATFSFRLGHPKEQASPSPRRAVEDVVLA